MLIYLNEHKYTPFQNYIPKNDLFAKRCVFYLDIYLKHTWAELLVVQERRLSTSDSAL